MSLHTYGKSSSAVALKRVVDKFDHISHKIAPILEDCNLMMAALSEVESPRVYLMLWHASRQEMVARARQCVLPEVVRSHLLLTLVTIMRNARRNRIEEVS